MSVVMRITLMFSLMLRVSTLSADDEISATQLSRLMRASLADIQDIECVFEGEIRRADGVIDANCVRYQGSYAFRMSDGSGYLDVYRHPLDGVSPYWRTVAALHDFELVQLDLRPDFDKFKPQPMRQHGGAASLNRDCAPTRYLFYWYTRLLAEEEYDYAQSCDYEFKGWEYINDRQCAYVRLNEVPGSRGSNQPFINLWIDMERGASPLKVEFWRDGRLRLRTHNIRLKQVALTEGRTIWVPVHGETVYGDEDINPAVLKEKCYVVDGSLRMNSGLVDSRFSVEWKSRDPNHLSEARAEFGRRTRSPRNVVNARTDPEGVQLELNERLERANAQSRQLDASAGRARGMSAWYPTWFMIFGGVLIVIVLIHKLRQ